MPVSGTLSHIDISVGFPEKSIPFYHVLLAGLGYTRWEPDHPGFKGPNPKRATWSIKYPDGGHFGIEVRPAHDDKRDRQYDRYEPGPHHLAFNADSREAIDQIYLAMVESGAEVLDAPADYSGQAGYSDGYYAVFFADPDGFKLEIVHLR